MVKKALSAWLIPSRLRVREWPSTESAGGHEGILNRPDLVLSAWMSNSLRDVFGWSGDLLFEFWVHLVNFESNLHFSTSLLVNLPAVN
jgi:hypothetical protein